MRTSGHLEKPLPVTASKIMLPLSLPHRSPRGHGLLFFILLLSILSLGAWWDRGKDKPKEEAQKKKAPRVEVLKVEAKQAPAGGLGDAPVEDAEEEEKGSTVVATKVVFDAGDERKEIERLREELNEIIIRTQQLQHQVKGSRSEIQGILERAQIHERILRDITLPQPIQMKHQINSDALLKQEKLRLISEQARQTQQQLRVIQQTRSLETIKSLPPDTRASKST